MEGGAGGEERGGRRAEEGGVRDASEEAVYHHGSACLPLCPPCTASIALSFHQISLLYSHLVLQLSHPPSFHRRVHPSRPPLLPFKPLHFPSKNACT